MLNGLDLFSGIGGISLALEPYVVPIAYCENEPYAQAVLISRMYEGALPLAPIWDDVRTFRGEELLGGIDIVYGGFPCQDISAAGRGAGLEGERSGLYWELHRIARETKPSLVFLENVPAIRTRGLDTVVRSLTDIGYDCRWTAVSAAEVGAPHLRNRWFLLAHARSGFLRDESGRRGRKDWKGETVTGNDGETESLADTTKHGHARRGRGIGGGADRKRQRRDACGVRETVADSGETRCGVDQETDARKERFTGRNSAPDRSWWVTEPGVGRVVDGLPNRMDRVRALGNAVVPLQVRIAYERLMGYETGSIE